MCRVIEPAFQDVNELANGWTLEGTWFVRDNERRALSLANGRPSMHAVALSRSNIRSSTRDSWTAATCFQIENAVFQNIQIVSATRDVPDEDGIFATLVTVAICVCLLAIVIVLNVMMPTKRVFGQPAP